MRSLPNIRRNCWRRWAKPHEHDGDNGQQCPKYGTLTHPRHLPRTDPDLLLAMTTTSPKTTLLAVAVAAIALLGVGLYLQLVENMLPCPLCVLQRYAFAVLAIACLIGAAMPRGGQAPIAAFGIVTALTGAGIAGWHLWIKAHPAVSCGIDPLETSLNTIPTARLFPKLFQADGLCTTEYPPIFGLSIPQWSLLWFALFVVVLAMLVARHRQR